MTLKSLLSPKNKGKNIVLCGKMREDRLYYVIIHLKIDAFLQIDTQLVVYTSLKYFYTQDSWLHVIGNLKLLRLKQEFSNSILLTVLVYTYKYGYSQALGMTKSKDSKAVRFSFFSSLSLRVIFSLSDCILYFLLSLL